mgnify:CR=1 FL=1
MPIVNSFVNHHTLLGSCKILDLIGNSGGEIIHRLQIICGWFSQALDDHRDALSTPDARGRQSVSLAAALKLVQHSQDQARALAVHHQRIILVVPGEREAVAALLIGHRRPRAHHRGAGERQRDAREHGAAFIGDDATQLRRRLRPGQRVVGGALGERDL